MRPLPPGWPSAIPGLPLLFIFIGNPDAREHAKKEKALGFINHVALPGIQRAWMYQWPTHGLMVIVILFERCEGHDEAKLIAELLADNPKEVVIRYWPGQQCFRCTP